MIKGWDRGLVDGDYTMDDAEAIQSWAEGFVARWPEATLLQLIAMTEAGEFGLDETEESE
jgi:hypothetical protein